MGISVICAIPWSLGEHGLGRSLDLANEAGFDGLQILPMRGWSGLTFLELLTIPKRRVLSFESAWNCGTFFEAIMRHLHIAGESNPLLHDWLLFGRCEEIIDRNDLIYNLFKKTALRVVHNPMDFGMLEMHPELQVRINFYADHPVGLVWDTEHVLRPGRHGEPPVTKNWPELLEKIKHNIGLIHVKNNADPKMLKALAYETDCPVIFEGRPPFGQIFSPPLKKAKERMIAWLKSRRLYLSYFFD